MEMIVLWSDIAIADLQDIHDYFFSKANKKVADRIILQNKVIRFD